MKTRSAAQRRHLATSPFKAQQQPEIERFAIGDRVLHDKYGLGRVIAAEDEAVTVDFGSDRVRIASPYPKMTTL